VENQLELTEEVRMQPVTKATMSKSQVITLYLTLALAFISLCATVFLYLRSNDLQDINEKQQTTINTQKEEIAGLTTSVNSLKETAALINGIDEKSKSLATAFFLLYVQHDVEGGVVTDDLTVEKLRLDVVGDNKLAVTIDVNNQPQMAAHYKGSGSYDLTDRELRAKSTELIMQVKERYMSSLSDGLPQWDDSNVYLTVKNYAIGNTTSGEFSLVGEK
jgi:hypothetical protein